MRAKYPHNHPLGTLTFDPERHPHMHTCNREIAYGFEMDEANSGSLERKLRVTC